jgi:hypothetical protein
MRPRILIFLGAAFGQAAAPAQATTVQIDADFDDFTESPDGETLAKTTVVPIAARTQLDGWDLSMTFSFKHIRGGPSATPEARRVDSETDAVSRPRAVTSGFTDLKISAEKSLPLAKGVSLNLLARFTLPTGRKSNYLGRGRFEAMLDAGLSRDIGKNSVWIGAARRFRSNGYQTTGRDITEIYAGASRPVGKSTTVRVDFLRAQSPYRLEKMEQSMTLGVSRALKSGATLEFSAQRYRDTYGKGSQGNVTLRWPLSRLF